MINEIILTAPEHKKLYIIDARSQLAAQGNRVKGGGFEQSQYYPQCQVDFGNIDNIHAVRDAYKKAAMLCNDYMQTKNHKKIMSKIEGSGWLGLLKNILLYSTEIAKRVAFNQQNALVHCSDGWDRTAQLCSLSEMMIDPFYRTLKGFEVIIEKEWVSFGHKFETRSGHFRDESIMPDERSPVFIQFLDA